MANSPAMISSNLAVLSNQFDTTGDENLLEWYTDMFENYPDTLVHYFSQDVVLQWFERTIRGPERILHFIKSHLFGTKHVLSPVPCESDLKIQNKPLTLAEYLGNNSSASPSFTNNLPEENDNFNGEFGQGDCKFPDYNRAPNHCETYGAIHFVRPYYKQGILRTKWERSCKLKIGYEGSFAEPINFTIQFMIYTDMNDFQKESD